MSKIFLMIICGLLSQNAFARVTSTNILCSFEKSNLSISIQNFKPGYQSGSSPLMEATFVEAGKTSFRKTNSAVAMGRGSWVANDLQDQRPAAVVDFENNRLVIYYCSGDGKTADAKFFTGHIDKNKASSFTSSQVVLGSCSGDNLTSVLTTDCSAFK